MERIHSRRSRSRVFFPETHARAHTHTHTLSLSDSQKEKKAFLTPLGPKVVSQSSLNSEICQFGVPVHAGHTPFHRKHGHLSNEVASSPRQRATVPQQYLAQRPSPPLWAQPGRALCTRLGALGCPHTPGIRSWLGGPLRGVCSLLQPVTLP